MTECQVTKSISQLSLKPGEEWIKRKGWWQSRRMENNVSLPAQPPGQEEAKKRGWWRFWRRG